jgi:hypothetical protein
VPVQSSPLTAYGDLIGTSWSADWYNSDGTIYVSDKVFFERLTGNNQFEGYGKVMHHNKEYKYSLTGEVSRTGIIVFIYKAERFPTEANIGTACLQLSIGADELEGAWTGFVSVKQPEGKKLATLNTGKLVMQKLKDSNT